MQKICSARDKITSHAYALNLFQNVNNALDGSNIHKHRKRYALIFNKLHKDHQRISDGLYESQL